MSLQELRDELLVGNRLPRPQSCPSKMSCLIQKCFSYQANDRPSFGEIKKMVIKAYEDLQLSQPTSTERHEDNEEVLQYADLQLQNRYLEMKIKNGFQFNSLFRKRALKISRNFHGKKNGDLHFTQPHVLKV